MSIYKKFKGQSQNYKVIIHREKASLTNFFFCKKRADKNTTWYSVFQKIIRSFLVFFFPLSIINWCNKYENFTVSLILTHTSRGIVVFLTSAAFNLKISALEPSPTVTARTANVTVSPSSTLVFAQSSVSQTDVSGYHFSWIITNFFPSVPKFLIILLNTFTVNV